MTISMYQASAPVFLQALKGLRIVLDKGEAFAKARKIEEAVLMQSRVYPDMFPFVRQFQIVCDQAGGCMSRLAKQAPPPWDDNVASFADLRALIDKTIAHVSSFKPEDIDGSEDLEVVIKRPNAQFEFTGIDYLLRHVTPNVHFHTATAYGLLRHIGVEVSKGDFLART